jgi:hypothetical protein
MVSDEYNSWYRNLWVNNPSITVHVMEKQNNPEQFIFWNIMPCSPLKVNRRFGGPCSVHLQGRRISQGRNQHEAGSKQSVPEEVSFKAYSLILMMEVTCSSETSVDFQLTTRRYIPEDSSRRNYRCENLKSYETIRILRAVTVKIIEDYHLLGCDAV